MEILTNILGIVEIACDTIILLLPWMILSAIHAVRKSIEAASAQRTAETQALLGAIEVLHEDLSNLTADN